MRHEPSGLLSDSNVTPDFATADTVLACYQHPRRSQPLVQTHRRILKHGPGFQGEGRAFVLGVALPPFGVLKVGDMLGTTARTSDLAVWPADGHHEGVAVLVVGEVDDGLL